MARKLAALAPFEAAHPVQSNAVFLRMTHEQLARLNASGWSVHPWHGGTARLMCSWATTQGDVEAVAEAMRGVL